MIEPGQLHQVIAVANAKGLSEGLVAELRQKFSGIHFTLCMDDDMECARPAAEEKEFNVYLVDSTNHCSKLTTNLDRASGIVLAEIVEDE